MVSRNAVAQDGLRLQLHPVALPFAPDVRISLLYFIDRLRQPQTFPGTLLDCARAQLDFGQRVQLGGSRMLELGGDGAPDYGGLSGSSSSTSAARAKAPARRKTIASPSICRCAFRS